jgi:predicted NACHT family NTPase
MIIPEPLQSILERIAQHQQTADDLEVLRRSLHQEGKLLQWVSQDGKFNVNIGEIVGGQVHIGDRTTLSDEQIQAIAQAIREQLTPPLPSATSELPAIDDLVKQARSRIHDDIQRLHGTMPLWGVDHWVPLGELFVDVNILEEVSSNRRSELADLWEDFSQNPGYRSLDRMGLGRERQRVTGLEVLDRNTNLMVVGKPGSGKTTYLQRVVTECNAGSLQGHRIPVLIRLREFVDDGRDVAYSVERYLEQDWRLSEAEVRVVLDGGRSLVLLDGLDEVTGVDGKAIAKQIKRFARDYPQVQVIVTCRTQSQESRLERFDSVEVADFNEPQVRAFSEHWFQTVCGDLTVGQTKATAFLEQLFREEHKPIRELAITPILLSLTCAVFQQKQAFYSKRSKLYEEGLELLLEQWDKSREIERDEIYRDLSVERKRSLLSYLAVKKFEQEQYVLFEQAEIEGYIAEFLGIGLRESRGVLRAIEAQHGLLIERSQKIWSFSHLTFQEYLVAKQLCEQANWRYLINQILETRWENIISLIPENISDLNEFKQAIDEILAEDQTFQAFLTWLEHKTSQANLPYKRSALKAFYFSLTHNLDRELSRKLDCHLEATLAHDLDYQSYPKLMHARSIAIEIALIRLDLKFAIELIDDVDCINQIRKIYNEFSNSIDEFMENLKPFSEAKKYPWGIPLRTLMIEHYNIGHEWPWSTAKRRDIEKYYQSNKLLVDCINSNNTSSHDGLFDWLSPSRKSGT